MTPERQQRIGQVYRAALELAPEERAAFLESVSDGDQDLRREVESLLRAHDLGSDYFATPGLEGTEGTPAEKQNPSLVGRRLSHYQLLSFIGAGGMGEVYLAQDTSLGRQVALKLLPKASTRDAERVHRFEREARAASSLNHPNIVTIYEIGQVEDRYFIAMEYIEGQTLRARLQDGQVKLSEGLEIAIQISAALSTAHEAGIVHRDIKPENVMTRRDGYVKVLDFGLAKLTEPGSEAREERLGEDDKTLALRLRDAAVNATDAGTVMGTAAYMSPEQARGEAVDQRTDIFSLGVLLYEMLAGRAPFEGRSAGEVISAILNQEPLPMVRYLPEVPNEVQWIVSKTLRKDRVERYQTIREMLGDLKEVKSEIEIRARLGRRGSPELSESPEGRAPSDQAVKPKAAVETGAPQLEIAARTSSAAIIFSELKRHQRNVGMALVAVLVIVGGTGFWLYRQLGRHNGAAPSALKITRLTDAGKVAKAVISPDGKYVAYAKDEAGQQSLWLIQVATASDEQIIPPADVAYIGLTFSHDGNFIYYVQKEQDRSTGTLYQKPVLGGLAKRLLTNVDGAITLSPDGKRLAFVRTPPPFREFALMTANVDGTEEKGLVARKRPLRPEFFSKSPAWSPDGKIIAIGVISFVGDSFATVVGVRVADGAEIPITAQHWTVDAGSDENSIGRVAWLSDGRSLVVTGFGPAGNLSQIWHLSSSGDSLQPITTDLNQYYDVSLTADSARLAVVRSERLVSLWIAPTDDFSHARQVTSASGREDGARGLDWTPDGKIIYCSMAGGDSNIWSMAADGTGNKQLSGTAQSNFDPAVSPDGRHIAWVSSRTGIFNIWQMDIDGSNPKKLTNGGGEWFPRFSHNGKWLVYRTFTEGLNNALWKMPIDGGSAVRLTDDIGWQPSVSPDGKLIAVNYPNGTSTKWQIALVPFEGGTPRFIEFVGPSHPRPVRWTVDGRALTYVVTRNGVSNIWIHPLDGSLPRQLTEFRDQLIFNFAWSRDGKQLGLSRGIINRDVVLMSGFK